MNIMKNIIIGTAGHVDHGKTQLIKALSGIDTDRLNEEKKRGITIELGFAHIPNDEGYNIGVIDVPGHEKFIKNMLAGIGGIDYVLFVVAADEGVMPQTKEHFEILKTLGIDDGIVAITKVDMVDTEWLELLTEDVESFVKGSFLEGKPIIPVSSKTGENLDKLKNEIIIKCDRPNKRREEKELFRLPVDRVFSMPGFGTVVTGTLMDGTVEIGNDVFIYPGKSVAKVRGIQTYGKETNTAIAGQRTAINLSNIKKEELDRGDVVSGEFSVVETSMIDVKLKIFESAEKLVLNNSRVHIYSGSKEALCKVVLMDQDKLGAGEQAYAQLRLEEPMALRRGDRFIIRFFSPVITIGGGTIIDALPDKHKRNRSEVISYMEMMEKGDLSEIVLTKSNHNRFLKQYEIAHELGILRSEIDEIISVETNKSTLIKTDGDYIIGMDKLERMKIILLEIIKDYHDANPLFDGISKQELISRLKKRWYSDDEKLIISTLKYFIKQNILEDRGKNISLHGFSIEYTDEQLSLKNKISEMYANAGIEMIRTEEIYSISNEKNVITAILDELENENIIKKINPSYYISIQAWNTALNAARDFDRNFTLAEYRDKLNTSRKYASELLQCFDKIGVTKFNGESRITL